MTKKRNRVWRAGRETRAAVGAGYEVVTPSVTAVTPGVGVHNAVPFQAIWTTDRLLAHALEGAQVDQDVDEGVEVGDGLTVAQARAFDAEFSGLGVDALGGGALVVDFFVARAVTVDLAAETGADASGRI